MSRYTFRIPTGHQYAYVEVEHEADEDLAPAKVADIYDEYTKALRFSGGLPTKDWNAVLDKYRSGGKLSVEEGERMNDLQREIIREIDKSESRLKVKEPKVYENPTSERH